MNAAEVARATAAPINAIGAKSMLIPETNDIGTELGFSHPFAFHTVGRGGDQATSTPTSSSAHWGSSHRA